MSSSDKIIAAFTSNIVMPLIKLMFIVAIAVFVYGIVEVILNQKDSKARSDGNKHILWGLVGLTIMLSVYGILNILVNTLKGIPQ